MLYELIAVVRSGQLSHAKEIARTTGQTILRSKGIIRGITNWGSFLLPRPTVKHQNLNHTGHYFIMRFDSSAATQEQVKYALSRNPFMIRYSVVKLGHKLGTKHDAIEDVPGHVEWNDTSKEQNLLDFLEKTTRGPKSKILNRMDRLDELD